MFQLHIGRPPHHKTLSIRPAWLLAPLGLAAAAAIGLMQGAVQSTTLALALVGVGLALLWLALIIVKPEAALLIYTLLAVNLNSFDLPLPLGGARVSPDIVLVSLLIVGMLLRMLTSSRPIWSSWRCRRSPCCGRRRPWSRCAASSVSWATLR